ncbi:MAG: ubiquinol-cytochrome c reductase iron-sulfur subunit [Anaerolineales bacterium]|nr:ubiquinol-cytochrome c reductase iron-sulfur subunit [Anaerolineales bacterium]
MTTANVATPAAPLTRREFLYYVWAASIALFMAEMGGALIWFALPRFKEGEFGGVITLPISDLPTPDSGPKDLPDVRIWLVNLGEGRIDDTRQPGEYTLNGGVRALYKICVHLGCLYKWVPTNDRFECPCHGSKYLASGSRIDGPATRNLDSFPIEFVDDDGNVLAQSGTTGTGKSEEGGALAIPSGAVAIRIDTGQRVDGAPNTQPGGGI